MSLTAAVDGARPGASRGVRSRAEAGASWPRLRRLSCTAWVRSAGVIAGSQEAAKQLVANLNRVARVVAASIAHHHVGLLGQHVDDLALALVAPLRPDDYGRWHLT